MPDTDTDDTIFDACLDATDDIWDDREAYIRAVLKTLRLNPDFDYCQYLADIKGFGLRVWPAQVRDA
jgi:hypothetical protein